VNEEMFCIDLRDKENTASFATRVQRAGDSLAIVIPRAYAEKLRLREGDVLDVAIRVLRRVR
jgi:bifunctional DNA-binding transcriptional regulator/antitoxin component of YhaV-PrlF toxin-antitoxin module